jgi:virginiamycin B lyase
MNMRIAGIAALTTAVILAACGGDDNTTPTPSPADTPSRSLTATPPADASTPSATPLAAPETQPEMQAYDVLAGSRPHDVAPAQDGGVWYTAQATGKLGWLDPETGEVVEIPLGAGSAPHGVIVDQTGDAWVTDGGQNAIVRVRGDTHDVDVFPLPDGRPNANLNTAAFDGNGDLWFTGQNGIYGRFDPETEQMEVFDAARGRGPYGITGTPGGDIYYASLAGSYLGEVDLATGAVTVLEPPTHSAGVRRAWSDSTGRIWISEWNVGQVGVYDPGDGSWREWPLPGASPQAYAVYVDDRDDVWLSDFGGNAVHRFHPDNETFDTYPLPDNPGDVRQILGRPGEVWLPESAADRLVVIRY